MTSRELHEKHAAQRAQRLQKQVDNAQEKLNATIQEKENWQYKPIWDSILESVECGLVSRELINEVILMDEHFRLVDLMVEREYDHYVKRYNIQCQCQCDHTTCHGQVGYAPRYRQWLCESCLLDVMEDDYKYNHTLHLL